VDAGGLGGDEQRLADLPVRPALGDQGQHLGLTVCEAERGRLAKRGEAQPRNPAVLAWAPVAAPSSSPVRAARAARPARAQPTVSHASGSGQRPASASANSSCWQGGATWEDRVVGPVDLRSAPEVRADTLALSSGPKAVIGREGKMHNQHAGLTGVLAEQRMTEHQQQATDERLMRSARSPRRRRQQATRRWWQLVARPTSA